MPMFWTDFFAGTEHVSAEAAKAYLFLLGHAWLRGAKLPDNDLALARMAGVGPRKWAYLKNEVMSFWTLAEGCWTQKRLTKEWDFLCRQRDIKRSLGKIGGKRSAEKRIALSREGPKQQVKQQVKHLTLTLTPIDSSLRSESKRRARARTPIPPDTKPDERDIAAATACGLVNGLAEKEWRKFLDYHLSRGNLMADWHAAWRTWCGNVAQYQAKQGDYRDRHSAGAEAKRQIAGDTVFELFERGSPKVRGNPPQLLQKG